MHFRNFEQQMYLANTSGRPRNNIYFIQSLFDNTPWVMKVSHINPQYKLRRKIDLFLTGLYKDYAKVSFRGAKALCECGIPVAKPLAFWTFKKNLFNKQSYFLSEKVAGKQTVAEWLEMHELHNSSGDDTEYLKILVAKIIDIIREIHHCHMRHRDIHLGNFYIHIPEITAQADIKTQLSNAELCLLDYDNCLKTKVRISWIKRFFDLKDLHKLRIPALSDKQLLTIYFKADPAVCWLRVLRFWKHGGFNVRRHLGLDRKQVGRHLKL